MFTHRAGYSCICFWPCFQASVLPFCCTNTCTLVAAVAGKVFHSCFTNEQHGLKILAVRSGCKDRNEAWIVYLELFPESSFATRTAIFLGEFLDSAVDAWRIDTCCVEGLEPNRQPQWAFLGISWIMGVVGLFLYSFNVNWKTLFRSWKWQKKICFAGNSICAQQSWPASNEQLFQTFPPLDSSCNVQPSRTDCRIVLHLQRHIFHRPPRKKQDTWLTTKAKVLC